MSRPLANVLPVIFIVLTASSPLQAAHASLPDTDFAPEANANARTPSIKTTTPLPNQPPMALAARALAAQYAQGSYQWKYWTTIANQHEGKQLETNPLLVETE